MTQLERRSLGSLTAYRLTIASVALLGWEALVRLDLLAPFFFSSPSRILLRTFRYFASGEIYVHLYYTVTEATVGLAVGLVTGVAVALLFANYPVVAEVLDPFLTALYGTPRLALAAIFIIWFGIGMLSKVVVVWSLVFFVVLFNAYEGIKSVDEDVVDVARLMGASSRQIIRMITLPSLFVWVFAALRTSLSLAIVGAVVGELFGSQFGMGHLILHSLGLFQTTSVYSVVLILAAATITLDAAIRQVQKRVMAWLPDTRPF